MTTKPSLTERLRQGRPLTGVFSIIPSTHVIEMIGVAGFEAVIIDLEHGPFSIDSLTPLILAATVRGLYPVVRVRANEPSLIGAVLDAGAAGVLVPQVSRASEAREVVKAARFAPLGARGVNPWVRAANYGAGASWFEDANRDVAVMVMIEGREGFRAIGDILSVPGLDAIFLGPVDLAQSLGLGSQSDHPDVIDAIRRTVDAAAAVGVGAAVFASNVAAAGRWMAQGVRFVALSEDTAIFLDALRKLKQDLDGRAAAADP